MFNYLIEGGILFMGMLSVVFLVILVLTVVIGGSIITNKEIDDKINVRLGYIKSLGLFGLILGMLGQFIGLFEAFRIIETGMEISPAFLAGGVRVSSITSIYGMIIFLVAYALWFILKALMARKL
jgi:biopolymer transport protein ExbB/TolQ